MIKKFNEVATLICKGFDEVDINYIADAVKDGSAVVRVPFLVECAPLFLCDFLVPSDDSGVYMCVMDIIHSVPEELSQDFNKLFDDLNSKYRYIKFFYSPKGGGVQIHYDFPACTPKEALPDMVKELYLRTRLIVNEAYPEIMKLMSTHWKIEKEVEQEFNDTMRDMDFLIALGEYQKNHAPDQPNVIDGEVV